MAETALVTGASSGIGLETSRLLLEKGLEVVGISRHGKVKEFESRRFHGVSLDLSDPRRIEEVTLSLLKKFRFDYLIHAAGQGAFGSIEQFSISQIDASIRLNLTSALVICRSIVPVFRRQQKGRLIFIGSESAVSAGKKGCLYSAAKFGLRGFCQALREDCGSDGIQVSLINPGMVRSPFFDTLSFRPGENPENAIETSDIATLVWQMIQCSDNLVIDEINLSPRVKTIDFKPPSTTR